MTYNISINDYEFNITREDSTSKYLGNLFIRNKGIGILLLDSYQCRKILDNYECEFVGLDHTVGIFSLVESIYNSRNNY